ncbi:transglutaminase family protein [Piscinibacter sakaiensis]|uniref:transglutaminase family protein n=1 Tax=Piscinibacter sakaiensis TaxID=1547922 RepID=UPI003AAF481D
MSAAATPSIARAVASYRVEHETHYTYTAPVSQSWQIARLTPRELPWQRVLSHELLIEPEPDEQQHSLDSFGNTVHHFGLQTAHRILRVSMSSDVLVSDRPSPAVSGLRWEQVRDAAGAAGGSDGLLPARMSEATVLLPLSKQARRYSAPLLAAGRGWFEAVHELMHSIHRDFEFDPEATTVSTKVEEVLEHRRGVCQDFAHLMLACLRSHGLPARYVSGYLLTDPPPGQPRLMGADATHAWVAAWSPAHGWVEFDPTNDQCADARYITLAWGADFADVVPLRGVILGGGEQQMSISVSVIPQD